VTAPAVVAIGAWRDAIITDGTNRIRVRFTIIELPQLPFSEPIVGASVSAFSIPEIAAAIEAAGIDPGTAVFESGNTAMVTIDDDGNATFHRDGRARITVRSPDGRRSRNVTVMIMPERTGGTPGQEQGVPDAPGGDSGTNVNLPPPVLQSIRLRPTANAAVGGRTDIVAYALPHNADRTGLVWTTSDETIATVENGIVRGVRVGRVTITVTNDAGVELATSDVRVLADARPVTSITLNRRTATINAGSDLRLSVTFRPNNATMRTVSWSSSDESVARVAPDGRVTGVSGGTATITATSDSGARVATAEITVVVPVQRVTVPAQTVTLRIGERHQLNPTVYPANATNAPVTYQSRSSTIASVTADGEILARRAGRTTITVRAGNRTTTVTVVVER